MPCMSRDINFGGCYLLLIKTARMGMVFGGVEGRSAGTRASRLNGLKRPTISEEEKGDRLEHLSVASAYPSQDPLIPDTDGDLLAIEIFKHGNRIFARYSKEIFEFDRGDFTMVA
jgi:hypothetical protein